jgi:hypothetical protein
MGYSISDVEKIVSAARASSSRQWVPGADGDPRAIQKACADFDLSRVAPEAGFVLVEEHLAPVLGTSAGPHRVWFITGLASQRVFLDEETGKFGLAWGPDSVTGNYVDLGFRTDDLIDAFLA